MPPGVVRQAARRSEMQVMFAVRMRLGRSLRGGGVMRGRSSGKTGPPVPGLTRVGGGAIKTDKLICGQVAWARYRVGNVRQCGEIAPLGNALSAQNGQKAH